MEGTKQKRKQWIEQDGRQQDSQIDSTQAVGGTQTGVGRQSGKFTSWKYTGGFRGTVYNETETGHRLEVL